MSDRFNVCNHIVWNKLHEYELGDPRATAYKVRDHDSFRLFFNYSERVIFCEHYGADNIAKGKTGYSAKCDELRGFIFEPLRAYLDGERRKAGAGHRHIIENVLGLTGHDSHYFSPVQWKIPVPEHYIKLQQSFPGYFTRPYEDLRLEYEDLRLEYEDLRLEYENLRRPFSVTADVPYTDVWTYPTVSYYPGKHPCEKNIDMLEHIITASSREGAIVLDSFSGSASTAISAINTNRRYICIEKDLHYFQTSCDRVSNHSPNTPIAKVRKPKAVPKGQLALF